MNNERREKIGELMDAIVSGYLDDPGVKHDYGETAKAVTQSVAELYDRLHPSRDDLLLLSRACLLVTGLNAVACITVLVKELLRR